MDLLSKLSALRPKSDQFETLTLGNGETIRCKVNTAIWAHEIDQEENIATEIAFYFATTPDGTIFRLRMDQLEKLTLHGKPTKTAELWSYRG